MASDIRKPPVREYMARFPQDVRGTCCWCGGLVTETTPTRGWLKYWHTECQTEYLIVTQPQKAADAVAVRDKGICIDCGTKPEPKLVTKIMGKGSAHEWDWTYEDCGWHVDHKIPLWKVSHLSPIERVEYFKLPNLVTRCAECHKIKTRNEAAERAHFKRLRGETGKRAKKKIANRPMRNTKYKRKMDGTTILR